MHRDYICSAVSSFRLFAFNFKVSMCFGRERFYVEDTVLFLWYADVMTTILPATHHNHYSFIVTSPFPPSLYTLLLLSTLLLSTPHSLSFTHLFIIILLLSISNARSTLMLHHHTASSLLHLPLPSYSSHSFSPLTHLLSPTPSQI